MSVEVRGIRDLRHELRKLENADEVIAALKREHVRVAEMVVDRAASLAAASGRRQMVVAAESNRVTRTVKGAGVRMGGAGRSRDWAMGAQFGAYPENFRQFPMVRRGGYTVYPAVEQLTDRIVAEYAEGLERVLGAAFPD